MTTEKRMTTVQREGKYLTFSLAGQEFGIGILKVREIMGMMPVTAMPQMPEYVKGAINLRGTVIPVVDFRLKFGMDPVDKTDETCIIVVEIGEGEHRKLVGTIVDSVSEVLAIREADIEDPPTIGSQMNTDFILGMAKANGSVKILLEIDRVLDVAEISNVQA